MARDMRHGYAKSGRPDFKRKSQQQQAPEQESSSKLIWLAAILVFITLLAAYIVINHFATEGVGSRIEAQAAQDREIQELPAIQKTELKPVEAEVELKTEQNNADLVAGTASKEQESKGIQFTFYQGLRETEVIVDAEPIPIVLPDPYYILAGTFRSYESARQEQERLKKLGHSVELNVLERERTFYRLKAGPFTDRLAMNKERNQLRRLGVDTLLIRVVTSSP